MASISCSYGKGLSTALTVSASLASDTENPSFTRAAASFRFAGVIRLRAPIWSSLPQRPQLERSFFQPSYSAAVTTCVGAVWDDNVPAASPTINNTDRLSVRALMLPPRGSSRVRHRGTRSIVLHAYVLWERWRTSCPASRSRFCRIARSEAIVRASIRDLAVENIHRWRGPNEDV